MMEDVLNDLANKVNNAAIDAACRVIELYRPAARTLILAGKSVDDVLDDLSRHIGDFRRKSDGTFVRKG